MAVAGRAPPHGGQRDPDKPLHGDFLRPGREQHRQIQSQRRVQVIDAEREKRRRGDRVVEAGARAVRRTVREVVRGHVARMQQQVIRVVRQQHEHERRGQHQQRPAAPCAAPEQQHGERDPEDQREIAAHDCRIGAVQHDGCRDRDERGAALRDPGQHDRDQHDERVLARDEQVEEHAGHEQHEARRERTGAAPLRDHHADEQRADRGGERVGAADAQHRVELRDGIERRAVVVARSTDLALDLLCVAEHVFQQERTGLRIDDPVEKHGQRRDRAGQPAAEGRPCTNQLMQHRIRSSGLRQPRGFARRA
ncbi:hypothetical protein [Burkholderia sp. BE17]|uniref:hypothetical protein n=1 Tax=Burkholderia sp. BE17 TaxID=2656644 RepID=UPI00187BB413|nr:hypothetical protein [Burkholderia sp. BE17]